MMEDYKLRGNGDASDQHLEGYRVWHKEQREKKEKEANPNRRTKNASGKIKTGKEGRFRQSGKRFGPANSTKKDAIAASVDD